MKKLDLSKNQIIEIKDNRNLFSVFLGKGEEYRKAKIIFRYIGKDINNEINIKAVLFDKSYIDLELILDIPKGSKGVNTYLKVETLMLSNEAKARVIPSLEIHEDEVKAGHAATIKKIDENELFYLTSRGLNKEEAIDLIVEGFLKV